MEGSGDEDGGSLNRRTMTYNEGHIIATSIRLLYFHVRNKHGVGRKRLLRRATKTGDSSRS